MRTDVCMDGETDGRGRPKMRFYLHIREYAKKHEKLIYKHCTADSNDGNKSKRHIWCYEKNKENITITDLKPNFGLWTSAPCGGHTEHAPLFFITMGYCSVKRMGNFHCTLK